jgi:hypothetical protein
MYDLDWDSNFTGKWHGDINGAIRNARAFLSTHKTGVKFKWNAHATVIVTSDLTDQQVLKNWEAETARLSEEYRRSPKGIAAAEKERKQRAQGVSDKAPGTTWSSAPGHEVNEPTPEGDWHVIEIAGKWIGLVQGEFRLVDTIGEAFKFRNAESCCKNILQRIKIMRLADY